MHRLLFLLAALLLGGCATNNVSKFYQDNLAAVPAETIKRMLKPYSGQTEIMFVSDPEKSIQQVWEAGYLPIGNSAFEGAVTVSNKEAREQAKKVGADLVLYYSASAGEAQVAVPLMHYNPGTISTTNSSGTVNANAYGSGGYAHGTANYNGTSTTTTPGTLSVQMVQSTVTRYTYHLSFWRRSGPQIFGARTEVLPDEVRSQLHRNTGAHVTVVVNGTPAFRANVMRGDVITMMAGEDVISPEEYQSALEKHEGQKVRFRLLREGKPIEGEAVLNKRPI